nr:hypothetical protein [Tanacetum cinerariifolium]
MPEAVREAVQTQTDRLQDSIQRENDEFLSTIDDNMKKIIKEHVKSQVQAQVTRILPRIEESMNAQLEAEVLTRSSHSSRTSYAVAADLSEMELKKILIDKMEGNKSIQKDPLLDQTGGLKDKEKEGSMHQLALHLNQLPGVPSNLLQGFNLDSCLPPRRPPTPDRDWNKSVPAAQGNAQSWINALAKQTDARSSFNELLETPIDFSNFIMNWLGIDTLTPELLADPTYKLMRGLSLIMALIYGPLLNSFIITSTNIPKWTLTLQQTGTLRRSRRDFRNPIEVEPLDKTPLEDLGLNTCNHDIPLSSREIPNFFKPKPQPQPLPSCPSLDINLGKERGPEQPIKPPSPYSFRMKEVDHLTNHTPPSPHVASFHLRDLYYYYRLCVDNPKKHYGFKPGLLGQSKSIGVDFSNMEMREDDWELEPIKVSFLGRRLNFPVRPKEVENVKINETHHLDHIIQQPIFQHVTFSHNNGAYRYYHLHLNLSVGEPSPLTVKIKVIFDEKKLGSS